MSVTRKEIYISVLPSLPSTPRRVPSGHGTKSSILYVHSPTVRPKDIVRLSGYPLIQDPLRGHPKDTEIDCLAVCGAPSIDFHLVHIVAVLRRSPAPVASSSSSSGRRADETLPRPQQDLEFVGHHRAKRVQIAE